MQIPRRFNTYRPNCKGHHEHEVEKVRTGRPTGVKWNVRQTRRGKATIGNTGKFFKVPGGDKPTKKTHLECVCSDCGKVHIRKGWHVGRLEFREQIMAGSFYKVACGDCENERVVFGKAFSVINYAVYGTTLATPTNGSAEFHGEAVETVKRRGSDELEA